MTDKLDAEQSIAFAEALLDPKPPNEALRKAADAYNGGGLMPMTVGDLRGMLAGYPAETRVLVFDHLLSDVHETRTIQANCILSMDHRGPVIIICNQDPE